MTLTVTITTTVTTKRQPADNKQTTDKQQINSINSSNSKQTTNNKQTPTNHQTPTINDNIDSRQRCARPREREDSVSLRLPRGACTSGHQETSTGPFAESSVVCYMVQRLLFIVYCCLLFEVASLHLPMLTFTVCCCCKVLLVRLHCLGPIEMLFLMCSLGLFIVVLLLFQWLFVVVSFFTPW